LSFIDAVHRRGDGAVAGGRWLAEHDDLGVLSPELDDRSHVGVEHLDRHGDGVDLLDEAGTERSGERTGARAGDQDADRRRRHVGEGGHRGVEQLAALLGLLGLVALVVAPADGARVRIEGDGFDGGRADVEPDDDFCCHPVTLLWKALDWSVTPIPAGVREGDACVADTRRNDVPMSGASDRRHTAFKADNVGPQNGPLPTAGSEKTWVR
jgi:hypothetical protein